jgi:hypothetical protein
LERSRTKASFAITERLRLDVSITTENDVPIKASLNLRGFIDGTWEPLVRYDTAHGSSHRHHFHPYGGQDEHRFVAVLMETFIEAAQADLLHNAETYLEGYELDLREHVIPGVRDDEAEHNDN